MTLTTAAVSDGSILDPVPARRSTTFFDEVPRWTARVLWVLAIICAVTALNPPLARLLEHVLQRIDLFVIALKPNLANAAFYGLLASVVSARKRVGWWVLIGWLGISILLNVGVSVSVAFWVTGLTHREARMIQWQGYLGCVVPALLLVLLIFARGAFTAKVHQRAVASALIVLVLGLIPATLVAWVLIRLAPGRVETVNYFGWALDRVTGGWLNIGEQLVRPTNAAYGFLVFADDAPEFVEFVGGLLGSMVLAVAFLTLFRSQTRAAVLLPADEVKVRNLLAEFGGQDSLSYFATRRDKLVIFAANGRAAISYRVQGGVTLASGDPLGDRESWPQAIEVWKSEAALYGWPLAVMGASEEGAIAYNRAGLGAIALGDEAILVPKSFDLSSHELKSVRAAVTRAENTGITVSVRRHRSLTNEEMAAALRVADEWRDTDEERGFSMALGRLGDPNDGECVLVLAFGSDEEPLGVLSLSPWGPDGASLDLMRRNPQAPNGTMELMIAELMRQSGDLRITKISLNFAVFRSAFEQGARIGAGPILRLWRRLLLFFSHWWQLEALYRSNVKYNPEWLPRFLCFSDVRNLTRISVASAMAEGYVNVPFSRFREREAEASKPIPLLAGVKSILNGAKLPASNVSQRPQQQAVRFAKLARLQATGIDPYPMAIKPSATIAQFCKREEGATGSLAGRLLLLRDHGGVIFARLRDWTGEIQLILERDAVGAQLLEEFSSRLDLGDLIQVDGALAHSRSGELSLAVSSWRLTAKCLRPLPDKFRGLTDPEARVRNRSVDLAINTETRLLTKARSAAVRSLRESLHRRGFLEVETPILQQVHGGANARPFTTHINAYDLDLYLRIAPELYLKRLCVGGIEKVFEIGRTFRNEGADWKHNPEFTILEAYEAHSDYNRMLDTCRELIQEAAQAAHGEQIALRPNASGQLEPFDISGRWPIKTLHDAVSEALGEEITIETSLSELRTLCDRRGIDHRPDWDCGEVVCRMYEHLVEAQTLAPTFYKDFPVSVSPLTKSHRSTPGLTERWDLVAWGVELGTAYSELTDPIEQRKRLMQQSLRAAGGDPEAMEVDEDFLAALEYGMPPTGGLGVGVDRVVMLLTGRGIRETLPFPLAKLQ